MLFPLRSLLASKRVCWYERRGCVSMRGGVLLLEGVSVGVGVYLCRCV